MCPSYRDDAQDTRSMSSVGASPAFGSSRGLVGEVARYSCPASISSKNISPTLNIQRMSAVEVGAAY